MQSPQIQVYQKLGSLYKGTMVKNSSLSRASWALGKRREQSNTFVWQTFLSHAVHSGWLLHFLESPTWGPKVWTLQCWGEQKSILQCLKVISEWHLGLTLGQVLWLFHRWQGVFFLFLTSPCSTVSGQQLCCETLGLKTATAVLGGREKALQVLYVCLVTECHSQPCCCYVRNSCLENLSAYSQEKGIYYSDPTFYNTQYLCHVANKPSRFTKAAVWNIPWCAEDTWGNFSSSQLQSRWRQLCICDINKISRQNKGCISQKT